MADQEYRLDYKSDNADMVTKTNAVIALVRLLDGLSDSLLAKLSRLFTGPARSAGNAATRFQAAATALQQVQTAAQGAGTALKDVQKATGSASGSVAGFTGSLVAMQAARAVLTEVLETSKELEQHWKAMAKEASDFRESLRELANVKGESGPNNGVLADVLDLGTGAGMAPEKAKELAQSWANFAPAVRDKGHIREGEEAEVLVEAGRTARRMGVGAGAMGDALGAAGLFGGIHSKEQAMEQVGGALKGLSRGSVEYTPGLRALNKSAAKLVDSDESKADGSGAGRVNSFAEAGVFLGALSLGTGKSADMAGHRMVQISRTLNPSADKQDQNKALRDAGITPGMSDPDKLIQLSKFLKSSGQAALPFLEKNKLGSAATREATVAGLQQAGVLEEWLKETRESARTGATGKATVADNSDYLKTDRTATAESVKGIAGTLDKVDGVQASEEFEKAKAAAEQRLRLKFPDYQKSLLRSAANKAVSGLDFLRRGVGGEGDEQEMDQNVGAIPVLLREGLRVGVDVNKEFPGIKSNTYRTRAEAFTKASDRVKAAGGDPLALGELRDLTRQRVAATRGGTVPAGREVGRGGPGAGGGGADPRLLNVMQRTADGIDKLNRQVGANRAAPPPARVPVGPLPADAPDGGPRRGG